ncbi:MAG: hypothetical protein JHC26_00365 [Thermofilum sp.]|jgi:hypothetical protein|uniref:hypothetical protein n=1 Tax=Thermofilum sp. TaxID=1961369 RepID=UPI002584B193|nr:hypothetical protein [Thermofilum sp.]MCI4407518.1 hypothetical protein [Thermofilum sp.]
MKLFVDAAPETTILTESTETGKNHYIEGIFIQADVKNRNGRVYPLSNIEKEMDRYISEEVYGNKAVGELNHPSIPETTPENVCIKIVEMSRQGSNYIGKAKVMNTPKGLILKEFLNEGIVVGVSSRALGSLRTLREYKEVQNDFKLIAVDVVQNPSAPDAFVQGIMESREWFIDNGILKVQEVEIIQNKIEEAYSSRDKSEKLIQIFSSFLKSLK